MADPFTPKFVDLVKNVTTTTGTGDFTIGAASSGFNSLLSALQVGDRFYYSCLGTDKPAEREIGRGTLLTGGKVAREPIGGVKTNFTTGNKTIALVAAAEWFGGVAASVASATSAADAASAAAASATGALATIQSDVDAVEADVGALEIQVASLDSELDVTTQDLAALEATVAGMSGGGGGASSVATRSVLAALPSAAGAVILREAGREGVFVWDPSDLQALVTADSERGLFVPPSGGNGSTGAWVRKFSGRALASWFGMVPANTAAQNVTSFNAALAALRAIRTTGYGYGNGGSIGLHIAAGRYLLDAEIAPQHSLAISGDYNGAGNGTILEWTSQTNGFHVQGYDGADSHGSGCTIENLFLKGAFNGTEGEHHAIRFTGGLNARNLFCENWPGDGLNGFGSFSNNLGNVNGSRFENIFAQNCRWTLLLDGPDANGCTGYHISGIINRRGGIADYSFLGNAFYGGVVEGCGSAPGFKTRCEANGHIYCVAYGQEAWCAANAPTGTTASNQGWLYFLDDAPRASQPTWSAGQTWYFAGALVAEPTNENMQTLFSGFYVETGENPCVLSLKSRLDPARQLTYVWTASGTKHGGYMFGAGAEMAFNGGIVTAGGITTAGVTSSAVINANAGLVIANGFYVAGSSGGSIQFSGGGGAELRSGGMNIGQNAASTTSLNEGFTVFNDGANYYGMDMGYSAGGYSTRLVAPSKVTFGKRPSGSTLQSQVTEWASISDAGFNLQEGGYQIDGTTVIDSSGTLQPAAFPALGGDVTTVAGTLVSAIANDAVTYAKLQNVSATDRLLGRSSAGAGDVEEILCTAAGRALLDDADAAAQRATLGLAPIAASGSGADLGAATVTFAKVQNISAARLLGNPAGATGTMAEIGLAGGLTFSGTDLTLGAVTPSSVAASGAVTSSAGKVGYATGAGGTVTQATSKSTAVTMNKQCGEITMNGAALAANTAVTFTLTNSTIEAGDRILLNHKSGGTFGAYVCDARAAAGSASVMLRNVSAGSLSEAVVLGFAVIKAVTT